MKEVVIYKSADSQTQVEVQFQGDTVWLSQAQMADLFERERSVVTRHIRNLFSEGEWQGKSNVQNLHIANSDKSRELDKKSTCSILKQVAADCKKSKMNIDMLLS